MESVASENGSTGIDDFPVGLDLRRQKDKKKRPRPFFYSRKTNKGNTRRFSDKVAVVHLTRCVIINIISTRDTQSEDVTPERCIHATNKRNTTGASSYNDQKPTYSKLI